MEAELAAMAWKIRWEDLDGDGGEKKEKKKKRSRKIDPFGPPDQSEALLRSNSRISVTSDKVCALPFGIGYCFEPTSKKSY